MFRETFPDEPLTVLVDYFGREITDALAVARRFPDLAAAGQLSLRLDTHGGRYIEGLDLDALLCGAGARTRRKSIRGYRTEAELRYLVGTGVSAAAIWHLRQTPRRGRLSNGKDRRQLGLFAGEMPHDGGGRGADRRGRHRLLPAGDLDRDLCHGRHRRL